MADSDKKKNLMSEKLSSEVIQSLWREGELYRGHLIAEYKYNPAFAWKILRQNESYKKITKLFWDKIPDGDKNWAKIIDIFSDKYSITPKLDLNKDDELKLTTAHFGIAYASMLGSEKVIHGEKNPLWFDSDQKLYKWFLMIYGDVILFPLPPEIEKPDTLLLNAIWTMRPVVFLNTKLRTLLNETEFKDNLSSTRSLKSLNVTINSQFSKEEITGHLLKILAYYEPATGKKIKAKGIYGDKSLADWSKIQQQIFVYAHRKGLVTGKKHSWGEIRIKYEKEFGLIQENKDKLSILRNLYAYAENQLLPSFDRDFDHANLLLRLCNVKS